MHSAPSPDGPRARGPTASSEREDERRHAQLQPVEDPAHEQERSDDPEADRHGEERDAEARLLGERLQVAVRQIGERQLQGVRRAQYERRDPDVDDEERRDDRDEVEAVLEREQEPVPRRTTSRSTSGPMSSASAPKSAQRARSSRHVVPDAPTASVGGGALTPTPKVKTPAGECPSSPITRQRTV